MSPESTIFIIGLAVVIITILTFVMRKLPKRIKTQIYVKKWRDIQKLCANSEDWSHAIVHADMLLEEVLKKKKITGKTMGEKLVNSEDRFTNNEALWNAHKLANSIKQNGDKSLKDSEVKEALIAFGQSLRDLGAL
ncbi:hypothetical protein KC960_03690 [Candidatus Saccharibacteria bacterium]|nr:hypothetical protein [Candidatus Saccharibacteria bacterium]